MSPGSRALINGVATVMVLLLTLFAILQYNDPDGWLWMLVYGYAAALGVGLLAQRAVEWPAWLGVVVYSGLALFLIPRHLTNWIEIEEAREAFGALICVVWFLFVIWVSHRRGGKAEA